MKVLNGIKFLIKYVGYILAAIEVLKFAHDKFAPLFGSTEKLTENAQ